MNPAHVGAFLRGTARLFCVGLNREAKRKAEKSILGASLKRRRSQIWQCTGLPKRKAILPANFCARSIGEDTRCPLWTAPPPQFGEFCWVTTPRLGLGGKPNAKPTFFLFSFRHSSNRKLFCLQMLVFPSKPKPEVRLSPSCEKHLMSFDRPRPAYR